MPMVDESKRCQRCYNANRIAEEGGPGIGNVYSVRGRRRYVRCRRCGFTWWFDVDRVSRTVTIEHSEITINGER